MTRSLLGAAATAAALLAAVPALAQTPPARPAGAPAAAPAGGGPVIAGVCIYNNGAAIQTSTVGRFLITRLQALETEIENELRSDGTSIETEIRALETGQATIAPQQFQQRRAAVQTRAEAFQRKRGLRQREMEATQVKALQRVGQDLDPIVLQVYAARGCGILVNAQSVFRSNPAMDITQQVVQALNGRLTTFTINRERLPDTPPAPAAGAAAAPRPATAPQTPPATRR